MPDGSRRYSEREVSLIIQAALDSEKAQVGGGGGLLYSEIEEIARETGISVDHVRLAVDRIAEGRKSGAARFLFGSDRSFEVIEVLPQALTQDELESLNRSLPSLTNAPDPSLVGGGTLTWRRSFLKSLLDGFPLRLSVRNAGQGTEIAASARLGSTATLFFGLSGGLGILAGMKVSALVLLLIGIGSLGLGASITVLTCGSLLGLGGFWLLARLVFRSFVKRSRGRVAAIVDRIKGAIQAMNE